MRTGVAMPRRAAIREAAYGAEHPACAHALSDLAVLLHDTNRFADTGRLAESEQLDRRALVSDEATYGPRHVNVARDCNNLAGYCLPRPRCPSAAVVDPCPRDRRSPSRGLR
jgi:hypothetical protein